MNGNGDFVISVKCPKCQYISVIRSEEAEIMWGEPRSKSESFRGLSDKVMRRNKILDDLKWKKVGTVSLKEKTTFTPGGVFDEKNLIDVLNRIKN